MVQVSKPVAWCRTGGTETFRRTADAIGSLPDSLASERAASVAQFKAEAAAERRKLKRELPKIERTERKVTKGGRVAVGRYALEMANNNAKAKEAEAK